VVVIVVVVVAVAVVLLLVVGTTTSTYYYYSHGPLNQSDENKMDPLLLPPSPSSLPLYLSNR